MVFATTNTTNTYIHVQYPQKKGPMVGELVATYQTVANPVELYNITPLFVVGGARVIFTLEVLYT